MGTGVAQILVGIRTLMTLQFYNFLFLFIFICVPYFLERNFHVMWAEDINTNFEPTPDFMYNWLGVAGYEVGNYTGVTIDYIVFLAAALDTGSPIILFSCVQRWTQGVRLYCFPVSSAGHREII
eukprot:SAG31_NODE_336_length_17493_cov_20.694032_13_plen_124_part_00